LLIQFACVNLGNVTVYTSVVLVTTIAVLVSYSKLIEWLLRCSLV